MFQQLLMLSHAMTGALALLGALWLYVDVLNGVAGPRRIRVAALAVAVAMWLTYLIAGHWYVAYYPEERALIVAGPWPAAHGFFMEMKEHVFITLLLLATWLPIVAFRWRPAAERASRRPLLWGAGLLVVGALVMEGAGALVALGVKLALLEG
jgi:hypothetical protein